MSSTFGSLMNITPMICFSVASMLGFSCSNEKVTVNFYCNIVQLVVPLCSSCSVYQFVGCPLMCERNGDAIPLLSSFSIVFCTSPSVMLVPPYTSYFCN
jgi:hypothetical protein